MTVEMPVQYLALIFFALVFLGIAGSLLLSNKDIILRVVTIIFGSLSFG
ncbi:MAG: hypothetical protein HY518_00330 [Candidatus Aenigmarchaeota archaeon]|nr:hypothetical protein [Candidatus Aenigmarchaeota archaeon]